MLAVRCLIARGSLQRLAVLYALAVAMACPAVLSAAEGDPTPADAQSRDPITEAAPAPEPPSADQLASPQGATAAPPPPPAPAATGTPDVPGGDPQTAPRETTPPVSTSASARDGVEARAAASGSVAMEDFRFSPATVTVAEGDSVTWTNRGKATHTATGDGFDTGEVASGKSGSVRFASAGNFSYLCSIHPTMRGTVRVTDASSGGDGADRSPAAIESGDEQGSSPGPADASGRDSASGAGSREPTLPSTGLEAGLLGMLGGALLALGIALRRVSGEDLEGSSGTLGTGGRAQPRAH